MTVARARLPEDATAALRSEIEACRICAAQFAATPTHHAPRPVVWFSATSRILVAGQAPGMRVYRSGIPFDDPSGVRLRHWLGMTDAEFYDVGRVAIVPMAFCFPGNDERGADLPPPPVCGTTWRQRVIDALPDIRLTVLVGGAAIRWHLGARNVTQAVRDWRVRFPRVIPLPHPSWRNTAWLKRNPWFEAEVLPALRAEVARVMEAP